MDSKIAQAIQTLITGTEQRKLNWEKAEERKAEFRLKLQHGWVTVGKWRWTDPSEGAEGTSADITFTNPEGIPIDSHTFNTQDSREEFYQLERLHEAARRNALRVDESLSGILGEIESRIRGH